jgi:hypothetical protein
VDLILRLLIFRKRVGRPDLMDQAILLSVDNRSRLDQEYLAAMTRREDVLDAYREMERLAALAVSGRRGARDRS